MKQVKGIVLAAGKGTRMKSEKPKVLFKVAGVPMVCRVLACLRDAGIEDAVVVVGYEPEQVKAAVVEGGFPRASFLLQTEQLGTAHAVLQLEPLLKEWSGELVVLNGDVPLLRPETVRTLLEARRQARADAALLTAEVPDSTGYGRIVRSVEGWATRIVEEADATPEERMIREINAGVYVFSADGLFPALQTIKSSPKKGEYYLTDLVAIWAAQGRRITAMPVDDPSEVIGVDTQERLKRASELASLRHGA